jgi:6-hydroxytryprostatin B O-methyltransferase
MSPLLNHEPPASDIAADCKSELESIAAQVSANATILSTLLRKQNLPLPSFDRDAPTVVLPQSAPDEIRAARQALIEASLRTFRLAIGPSEYIQNLAMSVCSCSYPS